MVTQEVKFTEKTFLTRLFAVLRKVFKRKKQEQALRE